MAASPTFVRTYLVVLPTCECITFFLLFVVLSLPPHAVRPPPRPPPRTTVHRNAEISLGKVGVSVSRSDVTHRTHSASRPRPAPESRPSPPRGGREATAFTGFCAAAGRRSVAAGSLLSADTPPTITVRVPSSTASSKYALNAATGISIRSMQLARCSAMRSPREKRPRAAHPG